MHYIVDAEYLGDYRLRVQFENGDLRIVELSDHLDGHVFEPLRDPAFFKQVRVNHDIDTVVWPNGADFSPDFLYEIGVPAAADGPAPSGPLTRR